MPIRTVLVDPEERCDILDDPPQFPGDFNNDPFAFGNLATPLQIPKTLVNGHAYGRVCQDPGPDPDHFTNDDAPASPSINVKQTFVIDVYWDLSGSLVSSLCGSWIVTIFFDCASDSTLDFQIQGTGAIEYGCPDPTCFPNGTSNNTRQYHASFLVPAGTVTVNATTGTPYELNVSIVLLDVCNNLPTGIVGSVPLEDVLFFSA